MMASCNLLSFLNQRLSLRLLTLVLAVIGLFSVTESAAQIQLRGEVGQNVTFHCPFVKHKTIKIFYLQRIGQDAHFVNGYHASKDITSIWKNTLLGNKTTVHMYKLNVSHSGSYECFIQYTDSQTVIEHIRLSVTAKYKKPTFSVLCDENRRISCMVTCTSQDGYPSAKMTWDVAVTGNTSSQIWKVLTSGEQTDQNTMLVNSSSTALFNCSYGKLEHLSCSVGDVTSDMFSVCEPRVPTVHSDSPVMLIAICAVVVVSIMVVLVLLWRYRKGRQTGAAAGVVRPEEVIVLSGYTGGEEAS